MCGIAGFVGREKGLAPSTLDAMAAAIRFRGPDAERRWHDGEAVHLLHSRLEIVDPAGGGQPMQDAAGRRTLVFAGEVHNYEELRRRYEGLGARFRTVSDTEVLLEGYRLRGHRVCEDIVGMFAFAVWDSVDRSLFLARDRLGEKPLFWQRGPEGLSFASDARALERCPGASSDLDAHGLAGFLIGGSSYGARTVLRSVRALPPGSWARVDGGDLQVEPVRYWAMRFDDPPRTSAHEALERMESLLTDAVRIRLRGHVRLGLTFSGGVDSGLIAAVAARTLGTALPAYTFDRHDAGTPSVETQRAERVADELGLPWKHLDYDYRAGFLDDLRAGAARFDLPCAQPELVQVLAVAQGIAPSAKVALTGNGADELLLGYAGDERLPTADHALRPLRALGLADAPAMLARRLRRVRASLWPGGGELARAGDEVIDEFVGDARSRGATSLVSLRTAYSLAWANVDANYRVPDIAGLSAGVEFRAPFLDHRLVEFAAVLPASLKAPRLTDARRNKWILRALYARHVPAEIAWATKLNMGASLRWDLEMGANPAWTPRVAQLLSRASDAAGLPGLPPLWDRFQEDARTGGPLRTYSPVARAMMLGAWLEGR